MVLGTASVLDCSRQSSRQRSRHRDPVAERPPRPVCKFSTTPTRVLPVRSQAQAAQHPPPAATHQRPLHTAGGAPHPDPSPAWGHERPRGRVHLGLQGHLPLPHYWEALKQGPESPSAQLLPNTLLQTPCLSARRHVPLTQMGLPQGTHAASALILPLCLGPHE